MKNREIEFKYKAKISLSNFKQFCDKKDPVKTVLISGYDHFYSKASEEDSFYRHRVNTNENQLTFKRKTIAENNFIREEHNIDLPLSVSQEKIRDLCNITGYQYNISIFKNCFIFNYEYYTLVYYIFYTIDLVELDRFIEIEMKEDYEWASEEEAYSELLTLEKLCKDLDVSPKDRVNKSLYEMYKEYK